MTRWMICVSYPGAGEHFDDLLTNFQMEIDSTLSELKYLPKYCTVPKFVIFVYHK